MSPLEIPAYTQNLGGVYDLDLSLSSTLDNNDA